MKKPIPFGKYYLLERINVGGMAEVFRAKAYGVEGFERLVAVKRILPNIAEDKEFIKMFIDEAKIAVQLNHANIAQIFDLGMVDQAYYIALEHIHGRDLRNIFDRCRTNGAPMPIAQACFVVMKVCEGLDYAHNKRDQSGRELNLVHRDVSPQNILVSFEGEVKLIDFGIAKAAGKGSKTQAGILKGKFGYMSPEQVRGLPIDRRSDIFACGIVLYELLTGERLFVGESDFSTLEKVRNVEILPPSTYNRKIPDELERIVLKALAKDDEDRYQNAIDLHDELQAFVYTAGEFYSRKDLAAWMKRCFAREIEEETAKLEAYRRLRPPDAGRAVTAPLTSPDGRRSTLALPSVAKPPPPPPVPPNNGRPSAQMAAAPMNDGLEWDDDELETQIYDNVADNIASQPQINPGATAPMVLGGAAGMAAAHAPDQPDLSSLVQTARGWDSAPAQPLMARQDPPAPDSFANGSNKAPSPFAPEPRIPIEPMSSVSAPTESSAVARLIDIAEPIFDSAGAIAMPAMQRKSRTGLYIGIAAAVVLLAGGITAAVIIGSGGGEKVAKKDDTTVDTAAAGAAAGAADEVVNDDEPADEPVKGFTADPAATGLSKEVLQKTGFHLIVTPDTAKVKINGNPVDMKPPMSIKELTPGDWIVTVEAPAGFISTEQTVTVKEGEMTRVEVNLEALEITGRFESIPPGAKVTLVSEGKSTPLGYAPATAKLDPSKRYEVVFRKRGYVTERKPITLTGRSIEEITAVMEREGRDDYLAERDKKKDRDDTVVRDTKKDDDKKTDVVKKDDDKDTKATKGKGILQISSKPPCKIYVDGRNTGKRTPQRDLELSVGRHKITLINNEYNIKETFTVNIKAGTNRVVKDMSDRIQQ